MRNVAAIFNRELLALFCSPVAYVVLAGFLLITGILASNAFQSGGTASLRVVFALSPYVLALIIPAITMRLISEEYRSGTIEALMTAPVTDGQMVLGKYLAALVFYALMLAATLVYLALMLVFGNPDLGAALSAYVGLLLMGTMFVAVGIFGSSLTSNQIVAWMVAAVPLIVLVWFAGFFSGWVEGWWREVFRAIDIRLMLDQTNRGLLTTETVAFFLGLAAYFLFLSVKVVESRRWR